MAFPKDHSQSKQILGTVKLLVLMSMILIYKSTFPKRPQ